MFHHISFGRWSRPGKKGRVLLFPCCVVTERWLLILLSSLVIIPVSMIKNTLPVWNPEIQMVVHVQHIINTHPDTHANVLSCSRHYHLNEAKYSPVPQAPSSPDINWTGFVVRRFLCVSHKLFCVTLKSGLRTMAHWPSTVVIFGQLTRFYLCFWRF